MRVLLRPKARGNTKEGSLQPEQSRKKTQHEAKGYQAYRNRKGAWDRSSISI